MKIIYYAALALGFLISPVRAELKIDVNGAMREPMPIAFPQMSGSGEAASYGERIREVVIADLERSGLFRIIPEDSYIQTFTSIDELPRFTDWKALNAAALIQSAISEIDAANLRVEFRLWDVYSEEQMKGQSFATTKDNWRRVAIMDQDGENHKFLTNGASMALTPRFSPNLQKITYLSYAGATPKVYMLDIETGEQKLVGEFKGMTFAPVFSPDSSKLLLSYAKGSTTDIYELDLKTGKSVQLTSGTSINTSPSYSPDGKQIVFNSDRGGNQQLYVMDADGGNVRRISYGNGRYATPVWSPRGDYIAFTKMAGGQFYIGVMYPDGSGERLITSGYLVEAPVWAPNGRVLMYFRQDKGTSRSNAPVKLYTIDLTGYNERMIVTPADASDPAWSPLLP